MKKGNTPPLIKRVFFIIAASAIVGLLTLGVGEFAVRWYVEGTSWAAVASFFSHHTPMSNRESVGWLVQDDQLGYKLNARDKHINSLGIRHAEIGLHKPDGLFRIIVLGDSVSWPSDGYVALLRERIGRLRDGPTEVINAAIPGYTTYQQRTLLVRDLLPTKPDLVILQYTLNDNHRFLHKWNAASNWVITPEALRILAPQGDGRLVRIRRWSYLLFAIRRFRLVYELRSRATFPWEDSAGFKAAWEDDTWPVFKEHLLAMRDQLTQIGGRLVVVAVPYEPQLRQRLLDLDRGYTLKPQRMLSMICREADVSLLDVFGAFLAKRNNKLFIDGIHLKPDGHAIVTQELVAFLEKEKLVPNN